MQLQFLGGTDTVTGSKHLITCNGANVVRDFGMYQGRRDEADAINRELGLDPARLNNVLLSHAHIDHCGMLPRLAAAGYAGPIHATTATAKLCEIMLRDAAHIQESDAGYLNQKTNRKGLPAVQPLYTMRDAESAIRLFTGHRYHQPLELAPGLSCVARDAGHILGSALTEFNLEEGGRRVRVGYAVDLGRHDLPLIRDPEPMTGLDVLVMESTYGDRTHDDAVQAEEQIRVVVQRTLDRGGKVLIPSFALERAQEIIYHLSALMVAGRLPRVDVFLDSPMASAVSRVFDGSREYLDEDSQSLYRSMGCLTCPPWVKLSETVTQSKAITSSSRPAIVIAASGMCEHGRILHHLKAGISDPRNAIVLVGYQAAHTLGRRLQEQQEKVRIFGDWFERRAEVTSLHAFSGHADRNDLIAYAKGAQARKIFLVHGEQDQREALAEALRKAQSGEVFLPRKGDVVEL
jgi:metallo-beta-lactamase family protein